MSISAPIPRHLAAVIVWLASCAAAAFAQGNYEVQVYGSELVAPGVTMVELHSNFTAQGVKGTIDGVLPTNHAEHESPTAVGSGWGPTSARA